MPTTQLRGISQIMDFSVTYDKLAEGIQDLINRAWTRVDFEATSGQTLLSIHGMTVDAVAEVYRNGVLLNETEFSIVSGGVSLNTPLGGAELMTVFWDRPIDTNLLFNNLIDGGAAG